MLLNYCDHHFSDMKAIKLNIFNTISLHYLNLSTEIKPKTSLHEKQNFLE